MARFVLSVALAAFAFTNMANAEISLTTDETAEYTGGLPVYSLHTFELREGVEAKTFEAFVTNEFAKVFAKPFKGVRPIVAKGDRGVAKGEYRLIVFFASKEIRDKYYPVEGEGPSKALIEDATSTQLKTIDKLATFVTLIEYTCFVAVGE